MVHPLGSDLQVEFMTRFILQVHEKDHFKVFLSIMRHRCSTQFWGPSQPNSCKNRNLTVVFQPSLLDIMLAVNVSLNQRHVQGWHLYQMERIAFTLNEEGCAVITKPTRPPNGRGRTPGDIFVKSKPGVFSQEVGPSPFMIVATNTGMLSDVFLTCDRNLNRA